MNELQKTAIKKLELLTPTETEDRLVASLGVILGDCVKSNSVFSKKGFEGVSIANLERPKGLTEEQKEKAVTALELSLLPASKESILTALKELSVMTVTKEEGLSFAESAESFVKKLSFIPADIALDALRETRKWFPSVGEILEVCEDRTKSRQRILTTIKTWEVWSDDEEKYELKKAYADYKFYSKHYSRSDPDRAKKFKQAADRVAKKLEENEDD